ncbi:MAG: PIN domain-containing protein [Gemmatimonadota bacterium]
MAVRAVLDVNVLVSAILGLGLGRTSPPVRALVAGLEGEYVLVASPRRLDELHAVLRRPRFGLAADLAVRWADLVAGSAHLVRTRGRLRVLTRDPSDNEVLECALRGRAGFLVTGNVRHFKELGPAERSVILYRGVRVVTPREFVGSALGDER